MPRRGENIYKRKDGRWEGRYIKKRSLSGQAVYGYVYAKTYSEVKQKLLSAKTTSSPATNSVLTQQLTVKDISDQWLDAKASQVKESTLAHYNYVVSTYINKEIGDVQIANLTSDLINTYIQETLLYGGKQTNGLSPKTTADIQAVLFNMLAFARRQNYLTTIPVEKNTIKQHKNAIRVFTVTEQEILCTYLLSHMNEKNLGILLCLFTGLRVGELCALQWEDISLVNKTLHVHQTLQRIQTNSEEGGHTKIIISAPKSDCSIRTIPLTDEIVTLLNSSRKTGYFLTGSVGTFVEPRVMQNYFSKVLKELDIEHATFHCLRHTFATRCVELGFDAKSLSELLGHSNVNITLNRYVHPSMEQKRKNMQKLSELIIVK